jgi:D-hydantoinase
MVSYDTIIRNGTVVSSLGTFKGDIGIDDGLVKTLSASESAQATQVINAEGKYVLPGVIDPHVHLSSARSFRENCTPETTSMAFGGVTSALSFTTAPGSFDEVLTETIDLISKESIIDIGLHAIIANIQQASEIPEYAKNSGVTSFKFYIGANGAELYPGTIGASDATVFLGFQKIAELGYPATAQVHAENWDICFMLRDKFIAEGRTRQADFTDSRPSICEIEGISRAILFAQYQRCRLYIVHVSTAEGPEMITKARAEGVNVIGETCPHYLALTKYDKHEVIAKVNPPIREKRDNEGLWNGLKTGGISCMGSDHIPGRSKTLATDNAFTSKAGGLPGSNMILPLLLSEGVRKGRLSLERVCEVTSQNAAKWFGLYPKKGSLLPESDADIVIVDPKKEVKVSPETMHLTSDYTWFRDWTLVGFPTLTMVRGEIVFQDGKFVGKPGMGKYLSRKVSDSGVEKPIESRVV